MTSSISNSLILPSPHSQFKSLDKQLSVAPRNLSFGINGIGKSRISASKRALTIQASYRGDNGSGNSSDFFGGFVLGGLLFGTLACVYAPQISKVLAGADKKDIMSKLPKFIYDEEKALEKTRKGLAEKIAQLSSAIDNVSAELRSEDAENGADVDAVEELELAL